MTISAEYDGLIFTSAVTNGLPYDWRYWKSQIKQESQFNPNAMSFAGAVGLAQFMPKTWKEWAPKAGYPDTLPTDPEASVNTGAAYMKSLWLQWSAPRPEIDRICLAMASYNAGLGNILKAQKLAGDVNDYKSIISKLREVTGEKNAFETTTYVKRILGYYNDEVTG